MKKLSGSQLIVAECIQFYLDWHNRLPSLGEIEQRTGLELVDVYAVLEELKELSAVYAALEELRGLSA